MTEAAWLTLIGVAFTALLGFFGARSTAHNARVAADRASELAAFRAQLDARNEQIASWRADAEVLRKIRDESEARAERRIAELSARIDELSARLDELTSWIRQATDLMRRADLEFPPPPILR